MTPLNDFQAFYDNRTVVVTGGAGFIGSHLARGLVHAGAKVRIIDDLSGGHLENLADLRSDIEFVEASILDASQLARLCRGAGIVFHEAALASVPASIEDPDRYHDVNVNGTLRVLQEARSADVARVVFASSSSVYGDQPELPKQEEQLPDPLSPYAQQKLTAEHMLRVWSLSYGMATISLRYFNIFGPGQSADSAYAAVVAAFAKALLSDQPPHIFGDGAASRDFTYIDNVVQANLRAGMVHEGASPDSRPEWLRGGVINIGCGAAITVLELAHAMIREVGATVEPVFDPPRAGDVLHSLADISRARTWLGYEPTVGLEEGLAATLEWYHRTIS